MSLKITRAMTNVANCLNIEDPVLRRQVLTIAAAHAVAIALPLPTSPLDGDSATPTNHYVQVLRDQASELLSAINECYVIDIKQAVIATQRIWRKRYNVLYSPWSDDAAIAIAAVIGRADNLLPANAAVGDEVFANRGYTAAVGELHAALQTVQG